MGFFEGRQKCQSSILGLHRRWFCAPIHGQREVDVNPTGRVGQTFMDEIAKSAFRHDETLDQLVMQATEPYTRASFIALQKKVGDLVDMLLLIHKTQMW